jgi:aryl-alcohol dehydrogenase-like predicted oxidoreductase
MKQIEFAPLGRATSAVGLGCGRLVGRSSLRRSARIVETALELGVRYFDVAPLYGMGTAEEVLGAVIGNARDVVVATKVGIPRPRYLASHDLARRLLKRTLGRARLLNALAFRLRARSRKAGGEPARFAFSHEAVRSSLEESLEHLRRDSVDVLLAHEPRPADLGEPMERVFRTLVEEGLITAFGVGVGAIADRWAPFGQIWQSGWPGSAARNYKGDVSYIWHGALRSALGHRRAGTSPRASAVVRGVLDASPHAILLVSASTPARLRELLEEV